MQELPKVSVLVATLNRARYLKRMLDALFEDDYPSKEVIVVDGASTDGTVELLKSYGDKITRWISEPDEGEYDALVKGMNMATGDIAKWMPDDDVLRPGAFRLAVDYLASHPDVDIVFGQTAVWREKKGRPVFACQAHEADPSRLSARCWLHRDNELYSPAAFVRRRVFDRIGVLSTEYSCGDTEFWVRAASRGVKMGLMPETVLDYHYTGNNGVVTKKWRLRIDEVRLATRYGGKSDVLALGWRRLIRPCVARPTNILLRASRTVALWPFRAWCRWRSESAGNGE